MPRTVEQRLLAKTIKSDDGCWLWTGANDGKYGYGNISVEGKMLPAHRVSYEIWVGPIPDGLMIDHLCRTPACLRPDHLEPVTAAENQRRGAKGFALTGRCQSGRHDMSDPANILYRSDGHRQCLPCRRLSFQAIDARRRAATLAKRATR